MSTHDYIIDNGTGAAVRQDLNLALAAIASTNSSNGAPATSYAYQIFHDTASNQGLKQRNSGNTDNQGLLLYRPLVRDGIYDPTYPQLSFLRFIGVNAAANQLTITNAIVGNNPVLSATGEDAHINLQLSPKGSASVLLGTGTTTNPSFAFTGDTNTGIYQREADMAGLS